MDQACSALGSENIQAGTATDNTGTSFNLAATAERPVFDAKFRLPCQLHVVNDAYLCVGWSPSGGVLLRYFRDTLFPEWAASVKAEGMDFYDALVAEAVSSPAGARGLVMLPHLPGALCPEMEPQATAAVFGVTLQSTRGDWARAMLESVACMTRANLDLLRDCGLPVQKLIFTGGAAKSPLWNSIKAGITGIAGHTLQQEEAGCLGEAMLAEMGKGAFADASEAVSTMVASGEEFLPPADYRDCAERIYGRYQRLFESLREMFKERRQWE